MAETNPTPLRDIMQYEPQKWAAADLLIAAGIKQSKFPDFMMPFVSTFMPVEKRNTFGAYQGAKYFTFRGEVLDDIRSRIESQPE